MPKMCFSYPSETENRGAVPPVRGSKLCFSYMADGPRDSKLCFSYHADIPLGAGNRDADQPPRDTKICFRY